MGWSLVTGGAGFIGSCLARRLLAAGGRVVVLDDLSTGKRADVPEGAEFVEGDAAVAETLAGLPDRPYEVVYHLAAQSSGAVGQKDPSGDVRRNLGSSVLLAEWCLRRGGVRLVFASSMTAYGGGDHPLREDAPCRPTGYYGASKLSSEIYLAAAARQGLPVACLRLFNVYGRGQNLENLNQGMASIYLAYLLRGGPVPVTGSLERYRDFVHVDDAVRAFMSAAKAASTDAPVFNVGSGVKTTVRELLALMIGLMGLPADHPVQEQAGSTADVFGAVADIDRAARVMGWRPEITLTDGLADMIVWARSLPA